MNGFLGQTSTALTSNDGGSVRLMIHQKQARSDSILCVGCWVRAVAENAGAIRVLISATLDCDTNTGIDIADLKDEIHVANLNLLSFRGTENGDKIDILYRV